MSASSRIERVITRVVLIGDGRGAPIAYLSLFLVLLACLAPPQIRISKRIDPRLLRHEVGKAFLFPLAVTGSDAADGSASLEVLENGKPLGPAHSLHDDIRVNGGGRFSHWAGAVYLSSSDGSDPQTNGRRYTVRYLRSVAIFGQYTAILEAFVFMACLALNARRLPLMGQRLRQVVGLSDRALYWIGFGLILVLAIAFRVVWTRSVYLPENTPDGYTYLLPALRNPSFPLDEARPIAFPYLISFSLVVFRHPIGILIVHNVLAVAAAATLTLALRQSVRSDAASLLLLAYMLFCAKNVAFEYLLLSEHLYRCVVALVLGILLWIRKPPLGVLALLAVLTLVGIFTKPTALVLLPAVLTGFAVRRWSSPRWTWREVLRPSAVYATLVVAIVCSYMTVFHRRYGSFQITSMTGFALYWNVNALTDLGGPAHPEVKRQFREFFPLYLEKYARGGRNLGDWAIWGSRTPEIERDFGERSPESVVRAYVQTHGSGSVFHRMDRVFLDLAIEGIQAHPVRYLGMSVKSTFGLLLDGLTFSYVNMPLKDTGEIASRVQFFRAWYSAAHVPFDGIVVPKGFRPLSRRSIAVLAPQILSRSLEVWFKAFLLASFALFGLGCLAAGLDPARRERLLLLAPLGVTIGLYLLLCGFIVPGEQPRYLEPIQDVVVASALSLFVFGWRDLVRIARRERPD